MKWSNMQKTLKDDDSDNDSSSDENEAEPEMKFEVVPHKGAVNRIRSLHGTGIVATWNDEAEVGIYNVSEAVLALDQKKEEPQGKKKKKYSQGRERWKWRSGLIRCGGEIVLFNENYFAVWENQIYNLPI